MYRSIPFMTQSFTSMHKLPRGRNFYPRGFDFAFGECDYFPPLRYLYSCRCLRTVNLAVVSIRSLPTGVSRRGRQKPPSMAWACLSAHRVRFPAVHFMPGCKQLHDFRYAHQTVVQIPKGVGNIGAEKCKQRNPIKDKNSASSNL